MERIRTIFEASGSPINFTGGVLVNYIGATEAIRARIWTQDMSDEEFADWYAGFMDLGRERAPPNNILH